MFHQNYPEQGSIPMTTLISMRSANLAMKTILCNPNYINISFQVIKPRYTYAFEPSAQPTQLSGLTIVFLGT